MIELCALCFILAFSCWLLVQVAREIVRIAEMAFNTGARTMEILILLFTIAAGPFVLLWERATPHATRALYDLFPGLDPEVLRLRNATIRETRRRTYEEAVTNAVGTVVGHALQGELKSAMPGMQVHRDGLMWLKAAGGNLEFVLAQWQRFERGDVVALAVAQLSEEVFEDIDLPEDAQAILDDAMMRLVEVQEGGTFYAVRNRWLGVPQELVPAEAMTKSSLKRA